MNNGVKNYSESVFLDLESGACVINNGEAIPKPRIYMEGQEADEEKKPEKQPEKPEEDSENKDPQAEFLKELKDEMGEGPGWYSVGLRR